MFKIYWTDQTSGTEFCGLGAYSTEEAAQEQITRFSPYADYKKYRISDEEGEAVLNRNW